MTVQEMQAAVTAWEARNFPDATPEQRALIVCEEAGELAHVVLKRAQNIRPESSTDEKLQDAIGDIAITLMVNCGSRGWDFWEIVERTAQTVLARNWRIDAVQAAKGKQ